MSTVTREHLAGLELALAESDIGNTESISVGELQSLIAQAIAAPEQEAVAWRGINELGEVVTEWVDGQPPESMVDLCGNPDSYASIELAYTHADPSEVERLRAALQHIIKTVGQSRSSTRRLRWIEQRAAWALAGREYDNSQFDLPRSAGNTAEKISQKNGELKRELAEAQVLLLRCEADSQLWYAEFGEPSSGSYQAAFVEIDAFLSATAQSAEVKS